jgi:hypothetical protein
VSKRRLIRKAMEVELTKKKKCQDAKDGKRKRPKEAGGETKGKKKWNECWRDKKLPANRTVGGVSERRAVPVQPKMRDLKGREARKWTWVRSERVRDIRFKPRRRNKMYMKVALVIYDDLLNNRPTKVKIGALFHQK